MVTVLIAGWVSLLVWCALQREVRVARRIVRTWKHDLRRELIESARQRVV